MRRSRSSNSGKLAFTLLLIILAAGTTAIAKRAARAAVSTPNPPAQVWGQTPLSFEANLGQTDPTVDYLARGPGYVAFINSSGATLSLHKHNAELAEALRMTLLGADRRVRPASEDQLTAKANYLAGNDPAQWKTGIPEFSRVHYRGVYPGVDVIYYGNAGRLEYDFVLQPGADVGAITLRMEGSESVHAAENGDLILQLPDGEIAWKHPEAYQLRDGKREAVASKYEVTGETVRFHVGEYDRSQPLIIDPSLTFGTYIGQSDSSSGLAVALDSSHNVYLAGGANSAKYPTTAGAFQTTYGGSQSPFVSKLSSDGSTLLYSTYIGDQGAAFSIAVDGSGNAYVGGNTSSTTFPVSSGALHLNNEGFAGFVLKLNSSGSALIYSAEIGNATVRSIAIDSAGDTFVTGGVFGTPFDTTSGAYKTTIGTTNCENVGGESFVLELNASGSAPVYSTYISDCEQAYGIALLNGEAYITGQTQSYHPVTPGAVQSTFGGYFDAFVTKLNTSGSALVYSTYLGGILGDQGNGIAVDSSGNAIVAGYTGSTNYPVANAFESKMTGTNYPQDAFVTKLNSTGTAFVYSTFLGGSNYSYANGVAVDSSGNAYVTGSTSSADYPTKDAFQGICGASNSNNCLGSAFVSKFSSTGSFVSSTLYSPPNSTAEGIAIATDSLGYAYIVGEAGAGLPTTSKAYEKTTIVNKNTGDLGTVFVAKINTAGTTGCTNLRQNRTVAICAPFTSSNSGDLVHVSAVVNDSNTVNAIQVYVDGTFVFEEDLGNQIDSYVQVPSGPHTIAVKAWDSSGSFDSTRTVNVSGSSSATCTVGEILPYVQICTPLANSSSSSPVTVKALATSQNLPVTSMRLYVDNTSTYTTDSSSLTTSVTLAKGVHKITVEAWDWTGQTWKQNVYTTVQ
jgi:hypothetical protein